MQRLEQGNDVRKSDLEICAVYEEVRQILDEHISMEAFPPAKSAHLEPPLLPQTLQVAEDGMATVLGAEIEEPRQRNPATEGDSAPLARPVDGKTWNTRRMQAMSKNAANSSGVIEHVEDLESQVVSRERHQLRIGNNPHANSMVGDGDDLETFYDALENATVDSKPKSDYEMDSNELEGRTSPDWRPRFMTKKVKSSKPSKFRKLSEIRRLVPKWAMINKPRENMIEQERPEYTVELTCEPHAWETHTEQRISGLDTWEPARIESYLRHSGATVSYCGQDNLADLSEDDTFTSVHNRPSSEFEGIIAMSTASVPNVSPTIPESNDRASGRVGQPSSVLAAKSPEQQAQTNFIPLFQRHPQDEENPIRFVAEDVAEEDPVNELIKKWTLLDAEKLLRQTKSMSFGQGRRL